MIGQIRGLLVEKSSPAILIEVGGVTYEVLVPMSTAYQLPEVGKELRLHTHFVVREDAQLLYGFYHPTDKALFRTLIKVNGVGPKMALAILSSMEAEEFARTVRENDLSALVNMPGIGKKTAERLLVEMRDRLSDWDDSGAVSSTSAPAPTASLLSKEAETALQSLGYNHQQASRAVASVLESEPDIADSETLIRLALKGML